MQASHADTAKHDGERGQVSATAAEIYDRFFLPALFARWADTVANAASIKPGDRVLDVACGTGILTLAAARRAGVSGKATGLDRNPDMLAQARAKSNAIDWQEAMAEALTFADGTFDAVVSQFGLMFFEDRQKALEEMQRVAKPGGRIAVAVWAGFDQTPGYAAMAALLERLFGAEMASALHAPYRLGDIAALEAMFAAAGLDGAEVRLVEGEAEFPSIAEWVHTDIKGWSLADVIDDDQYALLQSEAAGELAGFTDAEGRVRFRHPAIIVRATAN
ncbi:class I SAM-dependent methyltransferase [Oricola sp.]|uniref:class I SAM-dependent methyltransferase n=1 Tax=Oricola sp. TaxID=1979950 RepID=UPI003BAB864F